MDLIQQLHRDRKVTIILVTHNPLIAARAERTIHLRDGQVEDTSVAAEEIAQP